ncbi:hypothetical protein Chor_006128, partial [Crotalus horridus]
MSHILKYMSNLDREGCVFDTNVKEDQQAVFRVNTVLISTGRSHLYRPHPHQLVGKDCENGYYEAEFGPERRVL